ncbi:kinesin-like protein Klp98A [Diaphorina citri]|uniref:Kinesin-like protein Klp98A n=1 Tax=Diaphorina citri TaxID=121845 RepID=A0A3Q0IP07_DIACI|nr:kinesin-like protein Klp98A [Diaphorina citri]
MLAALQAKQEQEKVLTEEWAEKWRETQKILQEQQALGLRMGKDGTGVVLDSDRPHLVRIDDDLYSTGVTLYDLKEGENILGSEDADIVLNEEGVEPLHCSIVLSQDGVATLIPHGECYLNGQFIEKPTRLSQGMSPLQNYRHENSDVKGSESDDSEDVQGRGGKFLSNRRASTYDPLFTSSPLHPNQDTKGLQTSGKLNNPGSTPTKA